MNNSWLWVKDAQGFPRRHGTWTILERETWTGKYGIKVHRDKVIRPDGREGVYEWSQPRKGTAVLPIDDNGNAYFAQTFSYTAALKDYSLLAEE